MYAIMYTPLYKCMYILAIVKNWHHAGVIYRFSLFGIMAFPAHQCCGSVVEGLSSGTHLLLLLP